MPTRARRGEEFQLAILIARTMVNVHVRAFTLYSRTQVYYTINNILYRRALLAYADMTPTLNAVKLWSFASDLVVLVVHEG